MRSIAKFFSFAFFSILLLASCQKEYSLESGGSPIVGGGSAVGKLSGDSSTCANITIVGVYGVGLTLTDSNKVEVEMDFSQPGTFYISTDTLNGIYFSKSGTVTNPGVTRIELKGSGVPTVAGVYPFRVSFKGSFCTFNLIVYEVAVATTDDYFPTTTGSNWTYISSDPAATQDDTLRTTSTGGTVNILTSTYNVFTQEASFGSDSSFYRKGGGIYYEFSFLDVAGITTAEVPTEYIFLKDNVAAGSSWESPEEDALIDTVLVKIKLKLSVTEKNVNVLVDNKIYKNVIKVSITELVLLPGTSYTPVITYEAWYAKGIGLINVVAPAPAYGYHVMKYKVN